MQAWRKSTTDEEIENSRTEFTDVNACNWHMKRSNSNQESEFSSRNIRNWYVYVRWQSIDSDQGIPLEQYVLEKKAEIETAPAEPRPSTVNFRVEADWCQQWEWMSTTHYVSIVIPGSGRVDGKDWKKVRIWEWYNELLAWWNAHIFVYCWAGIDGCVAPFTDRYRSFSVYTGRFQRHTNHLYRPAPGVSERVYTNTKMNHNWIEIFYTKSTEICCYSKLTPSSWSKSIWISSLFLSNRISPDFKPAM